ncbi:MAG: S41 family peptidase [Thermoanaerobaculia bacterium]
MTKRWKAGFIGAPAALAAAIVIAFPAAALAADTEAAALDAARVREIVNTAADTVDSMYVYPDAGQRIADSLRARAGAGAYDRAGNASRLADLLSRDLQEIGKDRHLSVRVGPSSSGGPVIRGVESGAGPANTGGGGIRTVIRENPASPEGDRGHGPARIRREAGPRDPGSADLQRRSNFGFRSVERLDGNVGLLDIREFVPLAASRDTAAAAMAFLAASDAVLVDLRQCPGGAPDIVSFLASYFFGPERRALFSRYDRPMDQKTTEYTVEDLPGRRMPDTDLWILVGPNTASAGESFAYLLQQFGRATVVGERTAGAGHNNVMMPIGESLVLSVSVARPIHPRTGKGWEGDGVQPDVRVPAGEALPAAHAAALRRLIDRAPDPTRRRELAWALERTEAARNRTLPTPAELRKYAGRYGERSITVEDGGLVCRTATARARALVPLGRDTFSWDEQTRATFELDSSGRPARLLLERADGRSETFVREDSAPVPARKETR